jgi:murein DD-endopeptidase MepM/ murein hydrolase activator NlpD
MRLKQEAAAVQEAQKQAQAATAPPPAPPPGQPPAPHKLFMHVGVDLLATGGATVYAAFDRVAVGAAPNSDYGTWIRIDHADRLTMVYRHLSRFASGIEAGTPGCGAS